MGWTVREISELAGIPADSLRYYDRLGLISPKRENNKYRRYSERDLFLLQFAVVLKYAGFSLSEIKTVLEPSEKWTDEECRKSNINLTQRKCAELSERITHFKGMIRFLNETQSVLEENDNSEERLRLLEIHVQRNFEKIKKERNI